MQHMASGRGMHLGLLLRWCLLPVHLAAATLGQQAHSTCTTRQPGLCVKSMLKVAPQPVKIHQGIPDTCLYTRRARGPASFVRSTQKLLLKPAPAALVMAMVWSSVALKRRESTVYRAPTEAHLLAAVAKPAPVPAPVPAPTPAAPTGPSHATLTQRAFLPILVFLAHSGKFDGLHPLCSAINCSAEKGGVIQQSCRLPDTTLAQPCRSGASILTLRALAVAAHRPRPIETTSLEACKQQQRSLLCQRDQCVSVQQVETGCDQAPTRST
jgi:hypothetical protein